MIERLFDQAITHANLQTDDVLKAKLTELSIGEETASIDEALSVVKKNL